MDQAPLRNSRAFSGDLRSLGVKLTSREVPDAGGSTTAKGLVTHVPGPAEAQPL